MTVAQLRAMLAALADDLPVSLSCEATPGMAHPIAAAHLIGARSPDGTAQGQTVLLIPPDNGHAIGGVELPASPAGPGMPS